MKLTIRIREEEIAAALRGMAQQVLARFGTGEPVMVLALLNGATWFAADLLRLLPDNYMLETIRVSSYGDELASSGTLRWESPMPDCRGARVLLLDDVLDTGLTLRSVVDELHARGAAEVATAVVVDKGVERSAFREADFTAFHLGKTYLAGYGMDAAGRYRNLPCIAEVQDA